jgi:exopolysaccharide production protein ExoQ
MPPVFALALCSGFVLFLLWLERRQSPEVSYASWIPTLWMLYTASKPLGVWFQAGAVDAESGSPLDQLFLSGVLCLGLLTLAWRKLDVQVFMKDHPWVLLLLVYMLFSAFWSDITFVSFKRWIKELVAIVMALMVMTEQKPMQTMQSIFRRTVYILLPFSLLLIKYYPLYGVQYARWSGGQMWVGVTQQKNSLGRLCLVATFFLIWTFVRRWQGRDIPVSKYQTPAEALVLIITLWLLIGPEATYSATAITALAAGLSALGALLWLKERRIGVQARTLATAVALIVAFGVVTVFVGGATVGAITSTLGRDESLTGRADVWAALLPVALRKPLLGYGFGGFWTPSTRDQFGISEGHSGYLDVLLDSGFVGLALVTMFLVSSCLKAHREMERDYDWAVLWFCFLVMAAVHNIAESSFDTFASHLMAVLLFLTISGGAGATVESEEQEQT